MFYLTGYYLKKNNLRIRPVTEWDSCIVFTPDQPSLVMLNLNAWFMLELCTGRNGEDIEREYVAVIAPKSSVAEAQRQLSEGLRLLVSRHLVDVVPTKESGNERQQ